MSEFTNNEIGDAVHSKEPEEDNTVQSDGIETDVTDVFANNVVKQGSNEFFDFDCTKDEFFKNLSGDRKRLRFKNGSNVQQYMQKTKYKKPFYISFTDTDGKTYKSKIK